MARLDADRFDLPVLPLHHGRCDTVLPRQTRRHRKPQNPSRPHLGPGDFPLRTGELLTGLPYNSFSQIPHGYEWIKTLRLALARSVRARRFASADPLAVQALSLWLPPIVFVLFYVAAVACHLIIKHTGGLPDDFSWGNGLFNPLHLRIPGVLQRIGICYGIAATIGLFFGWRLVLIWAIGLMRSIPG